MQVDIKSQFLSWGGEEAVLMLYETVASNL